METQNSKTHILTESAIMIALATVLSMVKLFQAPYGGSVTLLSMVPIILISLRRGVKVGLCTGFAHGLLQLLLGLNNIAYVPSVWGIVICALTDYILPFTGLGLGGCLRNVKFTKNDDANLMIAGALGALLVTALRYVCHVIAGAVIWYALDLQWYADDPTHIVFQYGAWLFSVIYSGGYMIPEMILTTVATPILAKALRKIKA